MSTDAATNPAPPLAGHSSHPNLEAWVAYHAGELPDAERSDLQGHLTRCQRCVELVLDLDAFVDPSGSNEAGVADFEKAAVWRTLRGVRKPTLRWVTVAAMAASLVFATLGIVSWNDQQRTIHGLEARVAVWEQPQINFPIVDLRPSSRQRSARGGDATTVLPAGAATAPLILHLEELVEYSDYELQILDAERTTVWGSRGLEPTEVDSFHVTLRPRLLLPGSYELQLFGLGNDGKDLLEVYPLRLE